MIITPFANMATSAGDTPGYVTEDLTFYVDASDTNSYPGTGTTWFDLSDTGKDLVIVSAPTFGGTGDAKYFDLDGTADYFTAPTVDLQQDFSMEFVLQTDVNTDRYNIASAGQVGNGQGFHFEYRPARTNVYFNYSFYGGSYTSQYSNAGPLSISTWYHLLITYNDTTGDHNFYLNGVNQTPTYDTVTVNNMASGTLNLGRWNITNGNFWDGKWALSRLYYKELSSEEVTQNFDSIADRFGL